MYLLSALKKYRQPIFLAALLCLYYIFPKIISVFFEILFLFYVMTKNKKKVLHGQISPILWYFSFTILLFLTNIFRIDDSSFFYLSTCINNLIFVVITFYTIRDKDDVEVFVNAFGAAGFIFCLFLVPSVMLTINIGEGRMGSNIAYGANSFLSDSVTIGYLLAIINICQFKVLTKVDSSKRNRLLFLVFFLFSFFCILLSGTRKALLAILLCYFLYIVLSNRNKIGILLSYFSLFCIFIFIVYNQIMKIDFLYESIGFRIEGLIGYFNPKYADIDGSTLVRIDLIKTSVKIFQENPIWGAGIKATQAKLFASHPHNNYLTCLTFGGIFVFIVYYWIYFKSIINYFKKKVLTKLDILFIGLVFAMLLTDYAATTYNIIFFSSFWTIIYLNSIYT